MSFAETLRGLLGRIKGAEMILICGADGIPVEHAGATGLVSPDDLSAETSQLMRNIADALRSLELGKAEESTFATEKCIIVLRAITDEYYLAAVLSPGGNSGQARFMLRITAAQIKHEF